MDNTYNNILKCPYCKHEHDILDYIEVCDMDGEFYMECEECRKYFYVRFQMNFDIEIFSQTT